MKLRIRFPMACAVGLGGALLGGLSCQRLPGFAGRPSIVLVSIDTLRSDHLPIYGYRGVDTPAIDRLGADALVFEHAYSNVPLTLPSHASILTGELPDRHRVRDNSGYPLDVARHPTLAMRLKAQGYSSAGFVSVYLLNPGSGIAAGFDAYDAPEGDLGTDDPEALERAADKTVGRAIAWLEAHRDKPFFLFVHLYEPHHPYTPPANLTARHATPYDGEIAVADAAVGSLLDALHRLDAYDRSLVVLLSDHGEGLGDHGEAQHGLLLYREALQVPLLVKPPRGQVPPGRVGAAAELVDVAPTVLTAAGIRPPPELPGEDLLALAGSPDERAIYSETFYPRLHLGWSDLASIIQGSAHYIHGPRPELFDLSADPAEASNLVGGERRSFVALRAAVEKHDRRLDAPRHTDADTTSKLLSLGYLAGGAVSDAALPDPRDRRADIELLGRAIDELSQKQRAAGAATLEQLLARNPDMLDGWILLGQAYQSLARPEEALRAYRRAFDVSRDGADFAGRIAALLLELHRPEEAQRFVALVPAGVESRALAARVALARGLLGEALATARTLGTTGADEGLRRQVAMALADRGQAEDALSLLLPLGDQASVPTLNATGLVLGQAGKPAESLRVLRLSVAREPGNARSQELLGNALLRAGQAEQAREHLEAAVAADPRAADSWNSLGVARYQIGDRPAAMAAWDQAVTNDPGQFEALFNLGLVAAESGDVGRARQALRRFVAGAPEAAFHDDRARARDVLRRLGG